MSTPPTLVVVTDPKDWSLTLKGVEVVSARAYLTDPEIAARTGCRVINLCRSYRYQKAGYYVSLLGRARGHRPFPTLSTIQRSKSTTVIRMVSDEVDELAAEAFASETATTVELCCYFGQESQGRHPALCAALFGQMAMPLLRATFVKGGRKDTWGLASCAPIPVRQVAPADQPAFTAAFEAFLRKRTMTTRRDVGRYDLAILINPTELEPPSDAEALRCFEDAAEKEGFAVEFIEGDSYSRLAEFDALFIRETTAVNHRTFRFAQRAAAEGLVVIDDPKSILRCTNKVFLAEILTRHGVPAPKTVVTHRGNLDETMATLGFPLVLKKPDSSFSQGVVKVEDEASFRAATSKLLSGSDLIVAQAFTPSEFDWRIGILAGKPLYACKYFMAHRHWQIIKREDDAREEGESAAVPLDQVPPKILDAALRAAELMGDGLYGVDLKEFSGEPVVIEVNDNPSLDRGYEDALLGDQLYRTIMAEIRLRIDDRRPLPPRRDS